jgi:glyoxylase-like metal-dependent hydrolase (beta-lactamase superfamily II)
VRIHHLNCATFCPHARRLINGDGTLLDAGRLVCHCLLIEGPRSLTLVDTGLGTFDIANPRRTVGPAWMGAMRPRLDMEETALRRVRALGFRIDDVSDIVLTHLDFDHAGGLRDFPRARVHVWRDEHEAATRAAGGGVLGGWKKRRYSPVQWAHGPAWQFYEDDGESWFGFQGVRAVKGLGAEVLLVPLFGHSTGHCGVAVRTTEGWLLHAGDAYFHHREIEPPAGRRVPAGVRAYENLYQAQRARRVANRDRLRNLAADSGARVTVVCAHDPEYLRRHVRSEAAGVEEGARPGFASVASEAPEASGRPSAAGRDAEGGRAGGAARDVAAHARRDRTTQ